MAKNRNVTPATTAQNSTSDVTSNQQPKKQIVIDWGRVEEERESLESVNGKSWKQQDLKNGETEIIRLMLPSSGSFYARYLGFWINGVFFLSRKSLGQECELFSEYQQALSSKDSTVKSRLSDGQNFSFIEKESFVGALLNIKYDDEDEVSSVKFKGDKILFIEVNKRQAQQIFNYASMRENMAGTGKQSILHREKGKNIAIKRDGEGLQTEYTVTLLDRLDLSDEAFDKYYDAIPEISDYYESILKDDEYGAAVLRNYLYDEDIPDDFMDIYEEDYAEINAKKSKKNKSKFGKGKNTGSSKFSKNVADSLDDE